MVRKFLYAVTVFVVILIAGAYALRIWGNDLARTAFVPGGEFVTQGALSANAYADTAMWLSHPRFTEATDPARHGARAHRRQGAQCQQKVGCEILPGEAAECPLDCGQEQTQSGSYDPQPRPPCRRDQPPSCQGQHTGKKDQVGKQHEPRKIGSSIARTTCCAMQTASRVMSDVPCTTGGSKPCQASPVDRLHSCLTCQGRPSTCSMRLTHSNVIVSSEVKEA